MSESENDMSEQLQHLIEKIRMEGISKADAEAWAILEKARDEATRIEREAAEKASVLLKTAASSSQLHADRNRKALEQASRDMLLTVTQSVELLFTRIFQEKVDAAFTPETFNTFLHDAIKSYLAQGHAAAALEVTVPADKVNAIRDFMLKAFQETASQGITIRSSNNVIQGFRIAFKDLHVEHDFTTEAIAEALARLVRPHLAELLRSAAARPPITEEPGK